MNFINIRKVIKEEVNVTFYEFRRSSTYLLTVKFDINIFDISECEVFVLNLLKYLNKKWYGYEKVGYYDREVLDSTVLQFQAVIGGPDSKSRVFEEVLNFISSHEDVGYKSSVGINWNLDEFDAGSKLGGYLIKPRVIDTDIGSTTSTGFMILG